MLSIGYLDRESFLNSLDMKKILWLCTETFEADCTTIENSFLEKLHMDESYEWTIEVGPRLAFATAWSSNCESILKACGVLSVTRTEQSRRYKIFSTAPLTETQKQFISSSLHDRMTECVYPEPLRTFQSAESNISDGTISLVPILSHGRRALEEINAKKGLGFDDWDIDFYVKMFTETLKRDPTEVECFDLAQSNSEHSRHWFFGGKMVIDSEPKEKTLFQLVKGTLPSESNSIIAFHDNSSVR